MAVAAGLAYAHVSGGIARSGRPPLILIHGAGGDGTFWPPQLRRMRGEEIYAPDLPGHGSSPGEGAATIGGYAERLLDWARALDLPPAVWAGHSMGGAIALMLALRAPRRVAGLLLLGTGSRLPVDPRLLALLGDPAQRHVALGKIVRGSFSAEAPDSLVELGARRLAEADPDVLLRDFTACARFDETARMGEIRAPALVVCGREDRMTPVSLNRELAERLPRGRFEVVEGAGHQVMLEQPARVADAMRRFLNDLN